MSKRLILALIINSLPLFTVQAASFDCSRAIGFVEKTICTDKELSKLDSLLDSSYQKVIDEADQPSQVHDDQKAWIKKTRSACKSIDCFKQTYKQRIEELATVKKFYWKSFFDKHAGIQFIYPSNRTVHIDKNNIKIRGFLMPDGIDYIIHFQLGNGGLEKAIKETGIFEERKKGEWVAAIGRFENPHAEKISVPGWNGLKTNITCGISDKETGFHAAAGECLWALLSDGKRYLLADTQGISGLDENTMKTLMSSKFTDLEKP